MSIFPKSWGAYPPEYNREVHGPYNPAVYYGKRDTPFGEVKLGDLFGWLTRRRKSPRALMQAFSRAFWRYHITWVASKKPSMTHMHQLIAMLVVLNYYVDYGRVKQEKRYRYH